MGLEEPTRSDYFINIIKGYNIRKLIFTLVLVIWDPKAYNKLTTSLIRKHSSGGSLREAPVRPRVGKRAESPSLFVKSAKNQQAIKIKCAQKVGHHTNYRKRLS